MTLTQRWNPLVRTGWLRKDEPFSFAGKPETTAFQHFKIKDVAFPSKLRMWQRMTGMSNWGNSWLTKM